MKKYIASEAISKIQFMERIISCNEDGDAIVEISIKEKDRYIKVYKTI